MPRDGQGARLFYEGFSEPDVEGFIVRFLKPGMVFYDVGSHVGTYALLAATIVGPAGQVHAFEPVPEVFALLTSNVRRNGLANIELHQCAIWDADREERFEVFAELTRSALIGDPALPSGARGSRVISVTTLTLNSLVERGSRGPDLVKLDVEGAELPALAGATHLLDLPPGEAPALVFEYEPANYARFGYGAQDILGFLLSHGYRIWHSREPRHLLALGPRGVPPSTNNLFAAKDGIWLPSLL